MDMCAYARLGSLALIVKPVGIITWVVCVGMGVRISREARYRCVC